MFANFYRKFAGALCCLILLSILPAAAGNLSALKKEIREILRGKELTAGIAVCDLSNGETMSINGRKRFPMQSVYKFPIALNVFKEVEAGRMQPYDTILIPKEKLNPKTWSPIGERWPEGTAMSLRDVITYMVAHSDNNATDLLLEMSGGPLRTDSLLRQAGIKEIRVRNYEHEIQSDKRIQYENYATPLDMLKLLRLFNDNKMLSPACTEMLWDIMADTSTGSIRRYLPGDITVARKTGSSGVDEKGVTAAQNDAGIMELSDGTRIAYVIFLTNSKENTDQNYEIIARIGQALFNYFSEQHGALSK